MKLEELQERLKVGDRVIFNDLPKDDPRLVSTGRTKIDGLMGTVKKLYGGDSATPHDLAKVMFDGRKNLSTVNVDLLSKEK